jgi:hypothetical protein
MTEIGTLVGMLCHETITSVGLLGSGMIAVDGTDDGIKTDGTMNGEVHAVGTKTGVTGTVGGEAITVDGTVTKIVDGMLVGIFDHEIITTVGLLGSGMIKLDGNVDGRAAVGTTNGEGHEVGTIIVVDGTDGILVVTTVETIVETTGTTDVGTNVKQCSIMLCGIVVGKVVGNQLTVIDDGTLIGDGVETKLQAGTVGEYGVTNAGGKTLVGIYCSQ